MGLLEAGLFNGFCYGIAAIGLSLPLRFLGTADFTSIGSFMFAGISSILLANIIGIWWFGLFLGSILSGFLGIITSFLALNKRFNISLMLAGIITFIASRSFGMLLAPDGAIKLRNDLDPFDAKFQLFDIIEVGIVSIIVILILGLLARSKYGVLAFGMCTNTKFIKYRHIKSNETTIIIMFIANSLVGLAGGLVAINTVTAYTEIELEFLSTSFGAIFMGNAVLILLGRVLQKKLPMVVEIEEKGDTESAVKGFFEDFKLSLTKQRDDSNRMWVIYSSYIISALFLSNISTNIATKKLLSIPPAFEHLSIAVFIVICLFLSNLQKKQKNE